MSFKFATEASDSEYSYNLVNLECVAAPEQATRACTKCKETKAVDNFSTASKGKLGRRADCRSCRESQAKKRHAQRPAYPDTTAKSCTTCGVEKPLADFRGAVKGKFGKKAQCADCANVYYLDYAKKNTTIKNLQSAKRRAARTTRAPLLLDAGKVREIYAIAYKLDTSTGVKHNVDHIIPLNPRDPKAPRGLHNHFNLQVLTETENKSKSYKFNSSAYNHTIPQATEAESLTLWACLAPHRTQTHG